MRYCGTCGEWRSVLSRCVKRGHDVVWSSHRGWFKNEAGLPSERGVLD